eukprot:1418703-Rhodomonas_salina.1
MDNWERSLPCWYSHMVALAPAIIQEHTTRTEATLGLWTESLDYAMPRRGKMVQSGIPGTNKTVRLLHWAIKQLSYVIDKLSTHQPLLTSSMGYHSTRDLCSLDLDEVFELYCKGGQRKAQELEKWDPMWLKAFEYDTFSGVDLAFPDQGFTQRHFQLVRQGFERGLERVEKAMACALLADWKQTSRDSLCKGNKKEYPGILETTWPGVAALASHLGDGLPQLLHARGGSLRLLSTTWTHFQSRWTILKLREHRDQLQVSVSLLATLTDFLCSLPAGDFPLTLKIPDKPVLYTHASDCSAQIEYYVSQECTSQLRRCQTCLSTTVDCRDCTTLSFAPAAMDVRFFRSLTLRRFTGLRFLTLPLTARPVCQTCFSFAPAAMDVRFLRSLTLRQFTGLRFLTLPLTDTDCEYLFRHLPLGLAAGRDALPYEMIRDLASDPVILAHLRATYDYILAGAPIPDEWLGSLCSYLHKQYPDTFLENLRPVKLLPTTYKCLTSIVDSQLKAEMEHLGLLEDSQGGFQPGLQTQTSILKLTYAIEEARRCKGTFVVAMLDWFSAFDSVDLEKLYLLFEHLGMHQDDVNLICSCHAGAWVTVRTPCCETARVQVTRGSQQGEIL